ncbi:hypothetical protein ABEB36_003001 [Hypothenemus hampei]|uniref:Uncharacterized protein n=1 Tax=Hypothenemus hampei TaxID=57062 RepID=A0ABD1F7Q1_HYPHA
MCLHLGVVGYKMSLMRAQIYLKRSYSSLLSTRNCIQHLKERSLVQVKGPDASPFLQGLITNDINHLKDGSSSMFTMFLNTKGRILFDAIIYQIEDNDAFWIECDASASSQLQKHLKLYKIRRKIEVSHLDNYKIYVLYNRQHINQTNEQIPAISEELDTNAFRDNSKNYKHLNAIYIFKDPRVAQLGFRIIETVEGNVNDMSSLIDFHYNDSADDYVKLRYSLGIGEGTNDLNIGTSFPLECNCDYLHGISFHKGCYIGQELTARTHHTGVVRKRLMPLIFSKVPTILPKNDTIIHNNVNLGKLRGVKDNVGLGLLRINQALDIGNISIGNGTASIFKPFWWPVELPKEKLNVNVPN